MGGFLYNFTTLMNFVILPLTPIAPARVPCFTMNSMSSMSKIDFRKMRSFLFFALIIILGIAVMRVFQPFFYPIFWAAIIAIMFQSWYNNIRTHLKSASISAVCTISLVLLLIFLPLALIGLLVYEESLQLYSAIAQGTITFDISNITRLIADTPFGPYIDTANISQNATGVARSISLFVFNNLRSFTQDVAIFLFKFFVMIYTLFYFLKDGPRILQRIMHLSPLGDNYELMLYERFTSTARATIKGSFILGGIQGLIGGLLFFATGVQGALLWGVVMTLFSLIPGVGAFIVWLPVGVGLLVMGNIWQGVTVLLVGTFVISLVDNVLRPPLVGKDTQMHPILILFSTLGGIALFGMSGIIIGPVITALFLAVISIFDYFYQRELAQN